MPRLVLFLLVLMLIGAFTTLKDPTPYVFPELKFFPKMPQSIDNPVTVEGADLGRHLFYDSILSLNFDMSCATCHKQESAFSDAPNAFTKGNAGTMTIRLKAIPIAEGK
jgi:cytochrome c peroxidase